MVVLGIGSNIGDRIANLRTCLAFIETINNLRIVQISSVYKSDALLTEGAPSDWDQFYLNAAVLCKTTLHPEELLHVVKQTEEKLGRSKTAFKWAPRIIDIDILAWFKKRVDSADLNLPHPELSNRPFALWPFLDVLFDWHNYISDQKTINKIEENIKKWGGRKSNQAPFNTKQIAHRIDIPKLMGIVNITPDSFSDGGSNDTVEQTLTNTIKLFNDGAEIIDFGAESTRPNAIPISPEEETSRLLPKLAEISSYWSKQTWRPKISIDTRNFQTAAKALQYPIDFINDVSGVEDPKMSALLAEANVYVVFMHNLGIPVNLNNCFSLAEDPINEILDWALARKQLLLRAGIKYEKLIFDPGIGFGKTASQSLQILKQIKKFNILNLPLLVGHSRKSFLNLCTDRNFAERDHETAVISENLARNNVQYLRVHNVEHNIRNLSMQAIMC